MRHLSLETRMGMEVQHTIDGNVAVFSVSGECTTRDSGRLQASVDRALHRGFRIVVLNLEGVTHMGAASLGEVVKIYAAVRASRGQLRLAAVPGRIRFLFEVTGLAPFFESPDLEQQAVARLG